MTEGVSRRTMLKTVAIGSAGLLLRRQFAYAELVDGPVQRALPAGKVGLELRVTAMNANTLRMSVAAIDEVLDKTYGDGSVVGRTWPAPLLKITDAATPQTISWGKNKIAVGVKPLRLTVEKEGKGIAQELVFDVATNRITFRYGDGPIYGLGGGLHPLDRRGTKDMMRNGSGENLRVYGARTPIPWLVGTSGWGLFFHEPTGSFDLTGDVGVFHPSDVARGQDVFLTIGDTPAELMQQWAEISGYPHLPPMWALGYQQSHRTLESREAVLQEAKTFREKRLPCDAMIYLGTGFCPSGWNTGHGSFEFNENVFRDPEKMIEEFHKEHFKVVLHVVNPPENLHGRVSDTGAAAKDLGDAALYWGQHAPFMQKGVDGWWPDEGDVLPWESRLTRNQMYYEGSRMTRPDIRPYALHRNGYAGMQRYGWLWSGDVFSTWKTLETQVMIGINMGLTGVPYWGTDIGGFVPTKEFTAELFLRWFQFAAFCPLFRGHGRTWKLRLPWGWNTGDYGPSEMGSNAASFLPKPEDLHNTQVEPICRKFLETRYRLMPYLYSAVAETHRTGLPVIRGLWLHYPKDAKALAVEDAYLFGPHLLVAPVVELAAKERKIYLPDGVWWDFWTGQKVNDAGEITTPVTLDSTPVFVRAGAIVPTGPVKQYTAEPSTQPIRLTVYPGADGRFSFYEDDGISFAYERGDFTIIEMIWTDATRTLVLKPGKGKVGVAQKFTVALAGGTTEKAITFNHQVLTIQL
jgi:alpha-glucosidase (family GH31 glycosyl hydrolase)